MSVADRGRRAKCDGMRSLQRQIGHLCLCRSSYGNFLLSLTFSVSLAAVIFPLDPPIVDAATLRTTSSRAPFVLTMTGLEAACGGGGEGEGEK